MTRNLTNREIKIIALADELLKESDEYRSVGFKSRHEYDYIKYTALSQTVEEIARTIKEIMKGEDNEN